MSQMIKEDDQKSCSSCTSCNFDFPAATWLVVHRKTIFVTALAIAIISFICVWISQSRKTAEYQTIQAANLLAQQLQKYSPSPFGTADETSSQSSTQKALAQLRQIEEQYPSLQSRYDGLIAEELLLENKKDEIDPYASRSIQRLYTIGLTDFADFSEVSRLSALEQFKEALTKAMTLKERLLTQSSPTNDKYLLRSFLLLQIALLQKTLGETANFEFSIQELKNLLGLTKLTNPLNAQEKKLASLFLAHVQERNELLLDHLLKISNEQN